VRGLRKKNSPTPPTSFALKKIIFARMSELYGLYPFGCAEIPQVSWIFLLTFDQFTIATE
jgi:hypothetical protein